MRKLSVFLLFVALNLNSIGQFKYSGNWTYGTNADVFDGDYKIASVKGTSTTFPYNTPIFSIWIMKDKSIPEVCFKGVPYSGCDGKKVKIKFDNEETIYQMVASGGANNESWFIQPYEYRFTEDFFKAIKSRNIMHVRLNSDCDQSYDCSFSLAGSTVAINFLKIDFISLFDRK
jgi:hypothetical protein